MSFDVTLVEVLKGEADGFELGRYGIMEVQTMDFHGSYKQAVDALNNALDLHKKSFPGALGENLEWAGRGVQSPNIANVFKRTFYQMLVKFQLSTGKAAAGTVLALPRAVWDSWQPFLGAPKLRPGAGKYDIIDGSNETTLNAFICVFDIESAPFKPGVDKPLAENQRDISPVRTDSFIKVDPETLARHAFTEVPKEILQNIAGTDLISAHIRRRVSLWWPDLKA
jgi:hypothetical protein